MRVRRDLPFRHLSRPIATDSKWAPWQRHHTNISRKSLLYPTINDPALSFTDVDHSCSRYPHRTPSSTQLFLTVIHATVPHRSGRHSYFVPFALTAECRELLSLMEFGPHIRLAHRARLICSRNESLDLDRGPLLVRWTVRCF